MRAPYLNYLQDEEWGLVEPLQKKTKKAAGKKPIHNKRELVNTMLCVLHTGCSWRHLPHDFPHLGAGVALVKVGE